MDVTGLERLRLSAFERHDLVLAKLARNIDRDREDVVALGRDDRGGAIARAGSAPRPFARRPAGSVSHEHWTHADGRSVTIPLHGGRELGPPLSFKILRQLGVSQEDFDRLR
jgi:hypothetical protein